jgi:polygalacturonase
VTGYELLSAGSGTSWVNVRDKGAAGNGTADDTTAVQAAINALPTAGGTVYIPTGTYKLTSALTLRSNLVLIGDGDGPSLLHQTAANTDLMAGTALNKITIQGLYLVGTGAGTGSGLNLTKGGNDAVPYVSMRDVTVESFGHDGVAVENPIVSSFDRVLAQTNGRYGFNLYGQGGGAAGTSSALSACYGNGNVTAGFRLLNIVYATLFGCAADHNPIGYLIDTCQGVNVNGSGAEGNSTAGVRITGGYGITLAGLWEYDNQGIGIHVTGGAQTTTLIGATDNTPAVSATNFIKVDSGCRASLLNCNNTTANSLASGTTNVVADAAGGGQMQGYAALLTGGECDGDLAFYVAAKGVVLTDRTSGSQYRLKVTSGVLGVEAA